MCGMAISAGAQTMYDALNYSEYNYFGTARTVAMGNAFTALGGDLGGVMINPAGSAVAGYSIVSVTPSVNISVSDASGTAYNGMANGFEKEIRSTGTRFAMPNFGFSLNFDTYNSRGLKNFTFGVIANTSTYFNDNLQARGSNANTSFMGALAAGTNGWDISELTMKDPYNNSYAPWSSILAWQAGLISNYGPESNTTEYIGTSESYRYVGGDNPGDRGDLSNYEIWQSGTLDQTYARSVRGSRNDYLINMGFNFSDRYYFGFNLGITALEYVYQDWITETAQDPTLFVIEFQDSFGGSGNTTYFTDMRYRTRYEATGVGVYGKFGFIARPVGSLRIGGAIQTPTATTIKEYWQYAAESNYTDSKYNVSAETPEGQYRYRLISPFRFNVGIGYTFGSFAAVSADYEMCDYSSMRFKETETSDNSMFDNGVNYDIREFMGTSHMFRAGLEIKPMEFLAVRAGYGLTTSPEKYYDANDMKKYVKSYRNSFSAGLGYSSDGSFFADVAFRATRYADEYVYPYIDYMDFPSPEILHRKWMFDVMLTVGFRF